MRLGKPGRRSGFALILVMAQLTLLFSCWSIANRHTGAILQLENALANRIQRDEGSLMAVARGLALLETGTPPSSPIAYSLTLTSPRGDVTYLVTFTEQTSTNWQVAAARLQTIDTPEGTLPLTFSSTSGGGSGTQ